MSQQTMKQKSNERTSEFERADIPSQRLLPHQKLYITMAVVILLLFSFVSTQKMRGGFGENLAGFAAASPAKAPAAATKAEPMLVPLSYGFDRETGDEILFHVDAQGNIYTFDKQLTNPEGPAKLLKDTPNYLAAVKQARKELAALSAPTKVTAPPPSPRQEASAPSAPAAAPAPTAVTLQSSSLSESPREQANRLAYAYADLASRCDASDPFCQRGHYEAAKNACATDDCKRDFDRFLRNVIPPPVDTALAERRRREYKEDRREADEALVAVLGTAPPASAATAAPAVDAAPTPVPQPSIVKTARIAGTQFTIDSTGKVTDARGNVLSRQEAERVKRQHKQVFEKAANEVRPDPLPSPAGSAVAAPSISPRLTPVGTTTAENAGAVYLATTGGRDVFRRTDGTLVYADNTHVPQQAAPAAAAAPTPPPAAPPPALVAAAPQQNPFLNVPFETLQNIDQSGLTSEQKAQIAEAIAQQERQPQQAVAAASPEGQIEYTFEPEELQPAGALPGDGTAGEVSAGPVPSRPVTPSSTPSAHSQSIQPLDNQQAAQRATEISNFCRGNNIDVTTCISRASSESDCRTNQNCLNTLSRLLATQAPSAPATATALSTSAPAAPAPMPGAAPQPAVPATAPPASATAPSASPTTPSSAPGAAPAAPPPEPSAGAPLPAAPTAGIQQQLTRGLVAAEPESKAAINTIDALKQQLNVQCKDNKCTVKVTEDGKEVDKEVTVSDKEIVMPDGTTYSLHEGGGMEIRSGENIQAFRDKGGKEYDFSGLGVKEIKTGANGALESLTIDLPGECSFAGMLCSGGETKATLQKDGTYALESGDTMRLVKGGLAEVKRADGSVSLLAPGPTGAIALTTIPASLPPDKITTTDDGTITITRDDGTIQTIKPDADGGFTVTDTVDGKMMRQSTVGAQGTITNTFDPEEKTVERTCNGQRCGFGIDCSGAGVDSCRTEGGLRDSKGRPCTHIAPGVDCGVIDKDGKQVSIKEFCNNNQKCMDAAEASVAKEASIKNILDTIKEGSAMAEDIKGFCNLVSDSAGCDRLLGDWLFSPESFQNLKRKHPVLGALMTGDWEESACWSFSDMDRSNAEPGQEGFLYDLDGQTKLWIMAEKAAVRIPTEEGGLRDQQGFFYRINSEVSPSKLCNLEGMPGDDASKAEKERYFKNKFVTFSFQLRGSSGDSTVDPDKNPETPNYFRLRCDEGGVSLVSQQTIVRYLAQDYSQACVKFHELGDLAEFIRDELDGGYFCNTIMPSQPEISSGSKPAGGSAGTGIEGSGSVRPEIAN